MKKFIFGIILITLFILNSNCFSEESDSGLTYVFSKFEAKLYGYIKLDIIYDDSQTYFGNIDFYAKSESGSSDNQFHLTLNQTRLGFSIKGPEVFSGTPEGVIEMDFYGGGNENTPNPRLYRGFIQIKWPTFLILAGQDWDTHTTLYPTTLNFAYLSGAGNTMYRRPQLRLVKFFPFNENSKISIAGAIARTIAQDLDKNGVNDGDDSGWPTLEGRLAYENKLAENFPLTLAFSGHFGREEVDWDSSGSDYHYNSWSLNGELIIPFWKYAYLKGEYFFGRNLDAYYGGIVQGINTITRTSITASGGWGELTLLPTKKLSFHLGGGTDRPRNSDINDGDRSQNISAFGNIYYNITDNLVAGFEYTYFRTLYKNAPRGDNNRFQTSLMYNF